MCLCSPTGKTFLTESDVDVSVVSRSSGDGVNVYTVVLLEVTGHPVCGATTSQARRRKRDTSGMEQDVLLDILLDTERYLLDLVTSRLNIPRQIMHESFDHYC